MEELCIHVFGSVQSVVESRLGQPLADFCTLPGFRGEALGKLQVSNINLKNYILLLSQHFQLLALLQNAPSAKAIPNL